MVSLRVDAPPTVSCGQQRAVPVGREPHRAVIPGNAQPAIGVPGRNKPLPREFAHGADEGGYSGQSASDGGYKCTTRIPTGGLPECSQLRDGSCRLLRYEAAAHVDHTLPWRQDVAQEHGANEGLPTG